MVEPAHFRRVLGHFPTGVVVVTALEDGDRPVGMSVGSFTSVSLDPPLVAFLPANTSTSFPRIRATGSFCVNVLASDQEPACRAFATQKGDKFAGIKWTVGRSRSPVIDGAVAWIDCDLEAVHDAGDHCIVLGRVRALDVVRDAAPLLFFQGGYGSFRTASRSAPAEVDLLEHLRVVDALRSGMERISAELDVECIAAAAIAGELVILGSAGQPAGAASGSRIGQRSPFLAPLGTVFVAWEPAPVIEEWIARHRPPATEQEADQYRRMAATVRARGFSVTLTSPAQLEFEKAVTRVSLDLPTPEQTRAIRAAALQVGADGQDPEHLAGDGAHLVNSLAVPVRGADQRVQLALMLIGVNRALSAHEIEDWGARLSVAAMVATAGDPEPELIRYQANA